MALTQAGLSAAMMAELSADPPITTQQIFCDRLAKAIVDYIKANGQVTVVTTCPAGAGTGTGAAGSAIT